MTHSDVTAVPSFASVPLHGRQTPSAPTAAAAADRVAAAYLWASASGVDGP